MGLHAAEGVGDSDCWAAGSGVCAVSSAVAQPLANYKGAPPKHCAPLPPDEMELKLQAAHVHAKKSPRSLIVAHWN